jgi:hypothetical protein
MDGATQFTLMLGARARAIVLVRLIAAALVAA